MSVCQNSDVSFLAESDTSEHDSEVGYTVTDKSVRASDFSDEVLAVKKTGHQIRLGSLTGQEKQVKILPKKDVLRQRHKAGLEEYARKLHAINTELDYELTKNGKVQLAELAAMVKALKKEMEIVEAVELDVSREALWDMAKEGSSLRSLLESLKLKLETFLRHKPELKDKKSSTIKMHKWGCEFEACLAEEAKGREALEGMTEAGIEVEEKNKADLLRTGPCRTALHAAEKQIYKEKAGQIRSLNQIRILCQGSDALCVSNSVSCASIMVPGEEFESSREKEEASKKLEEGELVAAMLEVDAYPTKSSFPEFSIRNFVSTTRRKDIKMNWPFSQRSLKLCLKHEVKHLLPPFQSLDFVHNNFSKQCLAETILPVERTSLDEKPLWLKNHLVSDSFYNGFDQEPALRCTDSNSTPSGYQDFALKTTAYSQSEMESVSTSKVPLSEALDKQGVVAPNVSQKTKGASISVPNKKRRVVVKLGAKMDRGTADDITSSCTVPPDTVATKTCPVCGNFSSSSNTTLNAHIDQCLSLASTFERMGSSKTVKPRIKPRKLRLMSDICATAPCCPVEDLNIRNVRICVADADLASRSDNRLEGRSQRESLRHSKDTDEDNAVYVDANGTKIRILSKTNDASSDPKGGKELKAKKLLKKGKKSKFFSSKNKHLPKNLKLSKACIIKEQNTVTDSGNSTQSLCYERTVLPENKHSKGKRGRPKSKVRDTRDLHAESHQSYFANSNICEDIKKGSTVKIGTDSEPKSMKRNTSSCKDVSDKKGQSPSGSKSMISSPLFEGPVYSRGCKLDTVTGKFPREKSCVPEASEATQIHASPDVEIHANAVKKKDMFSCPNDLLSKGFHDSKGGNRLLPEGKTMPSSDQLSIARSTCSRVKKYHVHTIDAATVASSAEIGEELNSVEVDVVHLHDNNSEESTGSGSSAKLPTGEVVASFSRSSDPEPHSLTNAHASQSRLLQFCGSLDGAEQSIHLSQSCLGDIPGTFYASEGDRLDHNIEDIEQGCSFPLVESIPIPGPPGSYLPSFRDSCFEYLQGSSSVTTSWVQSSQHVLDGDGFNSDSPISGASTISGSTVAKVDLGASEKPPQLVPGKVILGSLDERTEPLLGNTIMTSVMDGAEVQKLTSDTKSSKGVVTHQGKESTILEGDCQPCCCSQKESFAWNSALDVQECQLSRQRMMSTSVEADLGSHLDSNLNVEVTNLEARTHKFAVSSYGKEIYENLSYASAKSELASSLTKVISNTVLTSLSPSDNDSTVLSPPVLRLMGKDLMVFNIDEHATARAQHALNGSAGTKLHSARMPLGRVYPSHDTNSPSCPYVGDPQLMPAQQIKLGY